MTKLLVVRIMSTCFPRVLLQVIKYSHFFKLAGRGRGDGGFYRDFDEDGFRSVRHGRGPSWGEEG